MPQQASTLAEKNFRHFAFRDVVCHTSSNENDGFRR